MSLSAGKRTVSPAGPGEISNPDRSHQDNILTFCHNDVFSSGRQNRYTYHLFYPDSPDRGEGLPGFFQID